MYRSCVRFERSPQELLWPDAFHPELYYAAKHPSAQPLRHTGLVLFVRYDDRPSSTVENILMIIDSRYTKIISTPSIRLCRIFYARVTDPVANRTNLDGIVVRAGLLGYRRFFTASNQNYGHDEEQQVFHIYSVFRLLLVIRRARSRTSRGALSHLKCGCLTARPPPFLLSCYKLFEHHGRCIRHCYVIPCMPLFYYIHGYGFIRSRLSLSLARQLVRQAHEHIQSDGIHGSTCTTLVVACEHNLRD